MIFSTLFFIDDTRNVDSISIRHKPNASLKIQIATIYHRQMIHNSMTLQPVDIRVFQSVFYLSLIFTEFRLDIFCVS